MFIQDIDAVIDGHTGLSRKVLEYSRTMKKLVDAAKCPGFSSADCESLARLVAVNDFQRVGNFKEVMSWQQYVDFLTAWAPTSQWECSFKRITERGDLVFLELEERSRTGEYSSVVNSVSVYDFGDDGRIVHLDIYLQMGCRRPKCSSRRPKCSRVTRGWKSPA